MLRRKESQKLTTRGCKFGCSFPNLGPPVFWSPLSRRVHLLDDVPNDEAAADGDEEVHLFFHVHLDSVPFVSNADLSKDTRKEWKRLFLIEKIHHSFAGRAHHDSFGRTLSVCCWRGSPALSNLSLLTEPSLSLSLIFYFVKSITDSFWIGFSPLFLSFLCPSPDLTPFSDGVCFASPPFDQDRPPSPSSLSPLSSSSLSLLFQFFFHAMFPLSPSWYAGFLLFRYTWTNTQSSWLEKDSASCDGGAFLIYFLQFEGRWFFILFTSPSLSGAQYSCLPTILSSILSVISEWEESACVRCKFRPIVRIAFQTDQSAHESLPLSHPFGSRRRKKKSSSPEAPMIVSMTTFCRSDEPAGRIGIGLSRILLTIYFFLCCKWMIWCWCCCRVLKNPFASSDP